TTRRITKDDVKKLFPRLAEPDKQKELDFMHSVSQSKWGVRGAANVYNNSVNNEDISYKGLLTMARTMGIGLL
ncbi:MAG: ATP-binding protein, partial [Pygmaiobacter sp.]